jgi:hypothetical protein
MAGFMKEGDQILRPLRILGRGRHNISLIMTRRIFTSVSYHGSGLRREAAAG